MTISQPIQDEALLQLQHSQLRLLDKIDELRNIGVGGLVELPQLIVCGNQSSGKSSVLEAISRVRFPAKSNVCTRFATEISLRRNPVSRIKVSIEPGPSRLLEEERRALQSFKHEQFSDNKDLPALIEQAQKCMGVSESSGLGFSDDILKVEISGPDKPELTLVDLPGLYYSTSREQGLAGIGIVRGLTERYMKNSRSIILAVISAKTDYHLQEVLNIAARFDPGGERTLGIITQPDVLEANSEEEDTYLQFMKNEKVHLKLGWHALRNRSFETRDISDQARDQQEKEFFSQGRWKMLPRESLAVDTLRRRLSSILLKHIRHSVPGLISDIQRMISDREQKLSKLGSPRSTIQQQRGFLLQVSSSFERITAQALDGMYADDFFGGLGDAKRPGDVRRLRAVIRQLNEYFAEAMATRGSRRMIMEEPAPTQSIVDLLNSDNPYMDGWEGECIERSALESEVSEQARENRGVELPGSANHLLVGQLFRDQSQPWEELARAHLLKACDSVRYFVELVLQHLADEHTTALLITSVVELELERMQQALLEKLDEIGSYRKRGHPLPVGKSFLTQMQKARTKHTLRSIQSNLPVSEYKSASDGATLYSKKSVEQALTHLETSRDDFAAAEIIDQMQAYYDTAILTFVDNVATLGIENCLLYPLQRILNSQVVNNMEDHQIQDLATEPTYVTDDRKRLSLELEKLQAGLRTLNTFKPLSIKDHSLFGTKSATATSTLLASVPTPADVSVQSGNTTSVKKAPGAKTPILPDNKSSTTTAPGSANAKPISDTGAATKATNNDGASYTSSSGLNAPTTSTITQLRSPRAASPASGAAISTPGFFKTAKDTSGLPGGSNESFQFKDSSGLGPSGSPFFSNFGALGSPTPAPSLFSASAKDNSGSIFGAFETGGSTPVPAKKNKNKSGSMFGESGASTNDTVPQSESTSPGLFGSLSTSKAQKPLFGPPKSPSTKCQNW
ncbi:P-loop containing nucleoside triphosphate hydrolase protein [Aspergillus karnatakaensis]|uniref:P-loop containing nucleoside triphosphate hydrolase protein n=1 Tax=Aspergillus karnatakaensis TaxID=1810916 RepID=UPI003CCCA7D1